MLADARLIQSRFNKINGSDDLGDHIVALINSKSVASSENEKENAANQSQGSASGETGTKT